MRPTTGLLLCVAVAVLAPAGAAASFTSTLPFTDLARATSVPIVSAGIAVDSQAAGAPVVMHNVSAFEMFGLEAACWDYPCHVGAGALTVRVAAGSTVALRFPTGGILHLEARHAIAAPLDLDANKANFGELAAGLTLAPSLTAATRDGVLTFMPEWLAVEPGGPLPGAPPIAGLPPAVASQFQAPDPDDSNSAVLAGLTEATVLEVVDGGSVVRTLRGYSGLLLQGRITAQPVAAEAFVVPCAERCDLQAAASGAAADVGAAVASLIALAELLQGFQAPPVDFGPWASLVNPVAGGAYFEMPLLADPADFQVANLTLVRFDRFQAALYPGAPAGAGSGELVIQAGDVQGSPEFVGGRYFGMPLWSYALWAAAVLALVLRLAVRRGQPKASAGAARLVGLAGFVVLAVTWHFAFGRILGLNATSPGLDAASRALVAGIELATLVVMAFMVVVPARLLLANGLRLVGLPRVARFAGAVGALAGAVVGPLLLLGIVDFALGMFA